MTADTNSALPPLTERSGALGWIRRNLFRTWFDSLLTILGIMIAYWALKGTLTWAFTVAEWDVVSANLRLFIVGQYPAAQTGRLWLWLGFLVFLSGNSLGIWARGSRVVVGLLFLPLLLAIIPFAAGTRTWLIVLTALGLIGWGLGWT